MKLKKKIAVLLTATMVLGMTVTAFADTVPGGGSATGAGNKEGHLEREIGNVVLPTTVSANAFDYTIDPERLVAETNAAKYSGATWATNTKENGVFFQIADNSYDYKTGEYEVVNKSTFPINVTVEVAAPATAAATDIPLVSENGLTTATKASLYLGLKVGATPASETAVPVLFGTPAKTTLSVNAVTNNFEASVSNNAYVYKEKAGVQDNTWQRTKFLIEGKTTNGANGKEGFQITDTTTAPALTVTWKWAKYGASAATELTGSYDSTNKVYVIELAEAVSGISDISNIKVNDVSLTSGISTNNSGTKLKLAKDNVKTAIGSDWDSTTELVFTFKVGSGDYTCTIAR